MSTLTGFGHRLSWRSVSEWRPDRRLATVLFVAGAILLVPGPKAAAPSERTIRIAASSFQYAPAIVHVHPGDRVTLELVSTDVVHGLYLDSYDLSLSADPGQTARLSFLADRAGTFRFRCSVTCGPLHPFMIGKLVVGTNWLGWRAAGLAILAAAVGLMWVRR